MLFSVLPTIILTGITSLVYAYGNYREVLGIGLATSVPRTVLYFLLVPYYGINGAAVSYLLGALIGFLFSLIVSRKHKLNLSWKAILSTLLVPVALGTMLTYFNINYIVGIVGNLSVTYFILYKLRVLTRGDLNNSAQLLPSKLEGFSSTYQVRLIVTWVKIKNNTLQ